MQLKWTKRALNQLNKAQDYIAQDNLAVAQEVAQRVASAAELLLTQPNMGRDGRVAKTQEWVVKKSPYILAYRVYRNELHILQVIHSKRLWPSKIH